MQSTGVVLMGILLFSLWSLVGLSHRTVAFCISHWGGSFCLVLAEMSWASEVGSTKKREEIVHECSDNSSWRECLRRRVYSLSFIPLWVPPKFGNEAQWCWRQRESPCQPWHLAAANTHWQTLPTRTLVLRRFLQSWNCLNNNSGNFHL